VKKSIFDIWWLYWPHCPFAIGSNWVGSRFP
jgi:hypothetical protein